MKQRIMIVLPAILLLGVLLSVAATKADLYRQFGPKLIDAVVQVLQQRDEAIKDKINELVVFANDKGATIDPLPGVSGLQIVNTIDTKLQSITNYQWMGQ